MNVDNRAVMKQTFEDVLGAAVRDGNKIEVLKNGSEIFPSMLKSPEASNSTIEFLTFIYREGDIARRFADMLSQKAREGVSVRLILDAFGCQRMPDALSRKIREIKHWGDNE